MAPDRILTIGLLLTTLAACAPIAPYGGVRPAPGALAFTPGETAAATSWWVPGSADAARHHLGTLAVPAERDSLVLIIYGDNRPGDRMLTTPWGATAVRNGFGDASAAGWLWGLANLPVALVQFVIPTLDGVQDLVSRTTTHRYSGGAGAEVLAAIERALPADLVVNTGDLVQDGRRGRQWEDFERRHAALRDRVPFVAAVGNHEHVWSETGRANWNAVIGAPAPERGLWFSLDLPDQAARLVVLDGTLLSDDARRYPDSLAALRSGQQLEWLDRALDAAVRHKIVFIHYPLVTSGRHVSDWAHDDQRPPDRRHRAQLLRAFEEHGVAAVFAGHEHLYQPVYVARPGARGFWHVTTGGGGSPLYPLTARARSRLRARVLPAGFTVHWPSNEQAVYHYCRLVLPRRVENGVRLDVHRVRKNGRVSLIDSFDLTQSPESR